jgi:hypothetical protein
MAASLPDLGGSASWMAMLALEHGRQVSLVAASHALLPHAGADAGASHPPSKHVPDADADDARKSSGRRRVTKAALMRDIAAARCVRLLLPSLRCAPRGCAALYRTTTLTRAGARGAQAREVCSRARSEGGGGQ